MNKIVKTLIVGMMAAMLCVGVFALTACDAKTVEVPGKSAYEIAVENGFEGTEAEWLASLEKTVPTTVTSSETSYSVNADGKTVVTVTLHMSDGSVQTKETVLPRRVVAAYVNGNVIMTAEEAKNFGTQAGLVWDVRYDDGSRGRIPVQASQVIDVEPSTQYNHDSEPAAWDGTFAEGYVYQFELCFSKYWYETRTVDVYICNDLATIAAYADGKWDLDCPSTVQVSDSFDLKTVFLYKNYNLSQKLNETYGGAYWGNSYMSLRKPVTAAMLDKPIDISTVGRKAFTVTYESEKYSDSIQVYDPEVSIVEYVWINTENDGPASVTMALGGNLHEALAGIIGADLDVSYYVTVNGKDYETVKITEDMIDTSGVDVNTAGNYTATVEYKGATTNILINVLPDMTTATKERSLTGNGLTILVMMNMGSVTQVDLYDNGYCEVFADSGNGSKSTKDMLGYMPYTLTGNTLEVQYGGEKIAIFTVDTTENTFAVYAFSPDDLTKTYTCAAEPEFTLKTYNNGYGELIIDMGNGEMILVVGYTVEGNVLKIAPVEMWRATFTIEDDNTLTINQMN